MGGSTTSGLQMETRQRLKAVTSPRSGALRLPANCKWTGRKPQKSPSPCFLFRILTVAVLALCTVGLEHSSRPSSATAEVQTPISNSKIFHHNRTTPAIAAMTLAQQQKKPGTNDKSLTNKRRPEKVSQVKGQRPKPPSPPYTPSPQHLNINNYFKTAINILSMGLGAVTTPKSVQWRPPFSAPNLSPSAPFPTTLHPLSVLKSSFGNSSGQGGHAKVNGSTSIEGRSALDFEPLFEASYDNSSTPTTASSGKKLDSSFFENFENGWDDSLAQESAPPNSFSVVAPPNSFNVVAPPNLATGSGSLGRPPVRVAPRPHPWANSAHGSSGSESNYANQKHVNYWPNKLNSYYGVQKPSPVYGRRPGRGEFGHSGHDQTAHGGSGGSGFDRVASESQYDEQYDSGAADSFETASSNVVEKTTIMDRVSVFYTNYKILAWVLIAVAAAVVAVGAVLGLYMNNPPTEVVTARKQLSRALNDPQILTFVETLLSGKQRASFQNLQNSEGLHHRGRT